MPGKRTDLTASDEERWLSALRSGDVSEIDALVRQIELEPLLTFQTPDGSIFHAAAHACNPTSFFKCIEYYQGRYPGDWQTRLRGIKNANNETPLHLATRHGHGKLYHHPKATDKATGLWLAALEAWAGEPDNDGNTVFHLLAKLGRSRDLTHLLTNCPVGKLDTLGLFTKNKVGKRPWHLAAETGTDEALLVFIDHASESIAIDFQAIDDDGKTALDYAALNHLFSPNTWGKLAAKTRAISPEAIDNYLQTIWDKVKWKYLITSVLAIVCPVGALTGLTVEGLSLLAGASIIGMSAPLIGGIGAGLLIVLATMTITAAMVVRYKSYGATVDMTLRLQREMYIDEAKLADLERRLQAVTDRDALKAIYAEYRALRAKKYTDVLDAKSYGFVDRLLKPKIADLVAKERGQGVRDHNHWANGSDKWMAGILMGADIWCPAGGIVIAVTLGLLIFGSSGAAVLPLMVTGGAVFVFTVMLSFVLNGHRELGEVNKRLVDTKNKYVATVKGKLKRGEALKELVELDVLSGADEPSNADFDRALGAVRGNAQLGARGPRDDGVNGVVGGVGGGVAGKEKGSKGLSEAALSPDLGSGAGPVFDGGGGAISRELGAPEVVNAQAQEPG
jgi:hypothetical protein